MLESTRYFEQYARISLKYCGLQSDNFIMAESPDLQSVKDDTGIEVTRAISVRERLYEVIRHEIRKSYPTLAADISFEKDMAVITAINGFFGGKIHIEEIEHSIITKTHKLNKNYKIFKDNYLYIFTFDKRLDREYIKTAANYAESQTADEKYKYKLFFINCVNKIHITDGSLIKTVNLGKNILNAIDAEVRGEYTGKQLPNGRKL